MQLIYNSVTVRFLAVNGIFPLTFTLLIMIELTKINGQKILVNCDLMELVEETPDTVVSFTTGRKIIVKESRQEIKNLVKSYKRDIFGGV